jgi:periplasmic divalent cation tolerance protein
MNQDDCIVVLVTVPDHNIARKVSKAVLTARLAACVNVLPGIQSMYWWEGKIADEQEVLLLIKTTEARFESLSQTIRSAHPYEVPEIVAVPVVRGLPQYIEWIRRETSRY